jgi:uncharacterized protein YkwD
LVNAAGVSAKNQHCRFLTDATPVPSVEVKNAWLEERERYAMKPLFAMLLLIAFPSAGLAAAESSPAAMISDFRLKHGEGRVTTDATLNRIALEQAKAMAAKDTLDHDVLGSFSSRIAPSKSGRAAENIAYGYDSFEKTLDQWIASTGHRKNLLLPKASRVGVASATSAASHRIYWAMEIADEREPLPTTSANRSPRAAKGKSPVRSCRAKILGICF